MKELRPVDVSAAPDVLRLAREVARSGISVMLTTDDENLAVLMPASTSRRPSRQSKTGAGDTLLNIIGIGESAEPTDVAERKHEYLAEAYDPANP